jgi:hypothetical protein
VSIAELQKQPLTYLLFAAEQSLGAFQSVDGLTRWKPRGYEWNGADRVVVTV